MIILRRSICSGDKATYSIVPVTLSLYPYPDDYFFITLNIAEDGTLEADFNLPIFSYYNLTVHYPADDDTYDPTTEIKTIPLEFMRSAGEKSMYITLWWGSFPTLYDSYCSYHTITFTVVKN